MSMSSTGAAAWPIRSLPVSDRWCVHSYYTLCPWAPDGSKRLLLAGADLDRDLAEVLVLDGDGRVMDRFGENPPTPSFWHTGFWQSWSPEARFVYYQQGTLKQPRVVRRELDSGDEVMVEGDMEGVPPSGEPGISCSHGLLYAAGYGDGKWKPEDAPVPFQARDEHGIYLVRFDPPSNQLALSTQQILECHPNRETLEDFDRELRQRFGPEDGLTLMTYCVRWNRQGTRMLFYFGNHCVVKERGEPRVASIFTADRELKEINLALDLTRRRGVHWSWHPDGEHIIGYGPDPDAPDARDRTCLTQVRYDGRDYRKLHDHGGGGHPSISPTNYRMAVTDVSSIPGQVFFYDLETGEVVHRQESQRTIGDTEPPGRNPQRVCLHPVFDHDGGRILMNTMSGRHATAAEITVPEQWR